MNLSTYISNSDQLNEVIAHHAVSKAKVSGGADAVAVGRISEVIISPTALSPLGQMTSRQVVECATAAREAGFKVFLEWDDLVKENKFAAQSKFFNSLPLKLFDAIRVKDVGVASFVNGHPDVKQWHFIMGYGNRNLAALKTLQEYFAPKLSRIVCSTEIPKDILKEWKRNLSMDIEVQIFGKILIFFSIRPLISIQSEGVKNRSKEAVDTDPQEDLNVELLDSWNASAESEESSQKKFFFHENHLGTSMFLPKELSLLSEMGELLEMGISSGRIDLRFEDRFRFLGEILNVVSASSKKEPQDARVDSGESVSEVPTEKQAVVVSTKSTDSECQAETIYAPFKEKYPAPLITGFFHANRTDRRFKHLKNTLLHRSGPNYLGEVREVVSGSHITVQLAARARLPDLGAVIGYLNPEGKEGSFVMSESWDPTGKPFDPNSDQRLVLLPHQAKLTVRTQLFLKASATAS